jgi:hypothetical protein
MTINTGLINSGDGGTKNSKQGKLVNDVPVKKKKKRRK